jgi:hypothetical protein
MIIYGFINNGINFPEKLSLEVVFPAPKSGLVIIKITRRPCGGDSILFLDRILCWGQQVTLLLITIC